MQKNSDEVDSIDKENNEIDKKEEKLTIEISNIEPISENSKCLNKFN